jgi:hypothetical protein
LWIGEEMDLAAGATLAKLQENSPPLESWRLAGQVYPPLRVDLGERSVLTRRLLAGNTNGFQAQRERMDIDHERLSRPQAAELEARGREKDAEVGVELEAQIEIGRYLIKNRLQAHANGRGDG